MYLRDINDFEFFIIYCDVSSETGCWWYELHIDIKI